MCFLAISNIFSKKTPVNKTKRHFLLGPSERKMIFTPKIFLADEMLDSAKKKCSFLCLSFSFFPSKHRTYLDCDKVKESVIKSIIFSCFYFFSLKENMRKENLFFVMIEKPFKIIFPQKILKNEKKYE